MDSFMLIIGLIMLVFCLYYPIKNRDNKNPRNQGIILGCIFGIGVSISIIIESLCQ